MEQLAPVLAPLILVAFWAVFVGLTIRTHTMARGVQALASAAGQTSYHQTGGARIGSFNATWPFALLVVTPDAVTLLVTGREYVFPKTAGMGFSRYRGFLSRGLRLSSDTIFWTTDLPRLCAELERFGYVLARPMH
jgi:hypothetical protein